MFWFSSARGLGCALLALVLAVSPSAWAAGQAAAAGPTYGPELQGFAYPAPVQRFTFTSQGDALQMAFMDVHPAHPNGRTIVLLHGKNFCGATWEASMTALSQAGYRVVVPDQIGFCKSSKPAHYQFSFEQLAANTNALLHSIGVQHATIMGHSTGGMLAIRYALMFPGEVDQLVLVDPIGLEDWQAKGVPWVSIDRWYDNERKTTADSIRRYEQSTYYAGRWRPQYQRWVDMLAGMYRGPGGDAVAWDSALLYDMIIDQPVVYDLGRLKPPTLLIVGDKDTTAIGKQFASPQVQATIGHYPELAKAAARTIPHATLIEFPDFGHAPQIQDPDAFHKALLGWLAKFSANP
jgi:pimeloyl-ACP methyl ester carboxylesterase